MKKIIILICLLCLIASFQIASAYDGTCGTNVAYTIDGNTISFSKADPDADAVWGSNCKDVFYKNAAVTILRINNTINILDGNFAFSKCSYIQEMNLSKFDVSNMTNMHGMFYECTSLESVDVRGWNTSNVTDMSVVFSSCTSLESVDVSGWDTSNVLNMYGMFQYCGSLTSLDVSKWNTSNATDMSYLFNRCKSLTSVDVSKWNTSSVTNMNDLFYSCESLSSVDVSKWNTSNVTNMTGMFGNCISLENVNVRGWDTSNVTDMNSIFNGCTSLESLDVSKWNTSNVGDMRLMFANCISLVDVDMSSWDTSGMVYKDGMFDGCESLKAITLGINTCKKNIFTALPNYYDGTAWYYISSGPDASNPLPLKTAKEGGSLFGSYDYTTMAGTWSTDPNSSPAPLVTSVMLKNSAGTDVTGNTITVTTAAYQLKASALPADAAQSFTWKSSDTAVAAVDSTGKVTFKKSGTVTITAAAEDGSGKLASVILTTNIKATSVVIKNSAGTDVTGKTVNMTASTYVLKASALPAGAAQSFTWKSSNTAVAAVNSAGKVTFKKSGTVTITATTMDDSAISASVTLTTNIKATKVVVGDAAATVLSGKTVKTPGTTYQLDAYADPIAFVNQKFTWKSSNTNIATVSSAGKVTFKKNGTVKITVTVQDGSGKSDWVKITKVEPESIKNAVVTVSSSTYTGKALKPKVKVKLGGKALVEGEDFTVTYSNNINAGKKAKVKITGIRWYKDSVTKTFTINPRPIDSNAEVNIKKATYTGKALKPDVTIKLENQTLDKKTDYTVTYSNNVEPGKNAKITITGKGNYTGTLSKTFTINKRAQPATLDPGTGVETTWKNKGKTEKITVQKVKENAKITYSTSDAKVATVKDGVITFKGTGVAEITVKLAATKHYKAKTIVCPVKVLAKQNITTKIADGDKITYTLDPVPLGVTRKGDGKITYKSSDTSIVNVDKEGNLKFEGASKLGTAAITITVAKSDTHIQASKTLKITTVKGTPVITASDQNHFVGEGSFALGASVNANVTLLYTSGNTDMAAVDGNGTVTINKSYFQSGGSGNELTVTIQSEATVFYNAAKTAVKIRLYNVDINSTEVNSFIWDEYKDVNVNNGPCNIFSITDLLRRYQALHFYSKDTWTIPNQVHAANGKSNYIDPWADMVNWMGTQIGGAVVRYKSSKSSVSEMKELLRTRPEGIMCFFTGGSGDHSVIIYLDGDTIREVDLGWNPHKPGETGKTWVGKQDVFPGEFLRNMGYNNPEINFSTYLSSYLYIN